MATEFKLPYTGSEINRRLGLIDKLDARINYLEAICSDNMVYYSTLNKAVTDVNNGTLANADANKNTAVAGVYTDKDGGKNVVLLKDTTEATKVSPAVDMTINLGGRTLTTTAAVAIDLTAGNLEIDGRLKGSRIENANIGVATKIVQTAVNTNLVVVGGSYFANTDGKSNQVFLLYGKADISNADISGQETTRGGAAVYVLGTGEAAISNCRISYKKTGSGKNTAYGVCNAGIVRLYNCDILASSASISVGIQNDATATMYSCAVRAYSPYTENEHSQGVYNNTTGKMTINNCYVFGTHSGVQSGGTLYVDGGTYESYGHGGIYFTGDSNTSYVRNAILRNCDMPDGYVDNGGGNNGSGFYLGDGNNITVYMDNCRIQGKNRTSQVFVLKNSYKTLYISNSTIPEGTKIRIDTDSNKLYIGKGCNFTAEDTNRPSSVIQTDEVYVQAT